MPIPRIAESVADARVSLQRLSDARIVHGWVSEFDTTWFTARLTGNLSVAPGDKFTVRVFREGGDLAFIALARSAASGIFRFDIEGKISVHEPQGDPRYSRQTPAYIDDFPATVVDVSPQGIGLITAVPFRPGDQITVAVEGVQVRGEVRYCRPLRDAGSNYRIGLRLVPMDRIGRARWSEIVHAARESASSGSSRLAS
jgi:hypothetical protein